MIVVSSVHAWSLRNSKSGLYDTASGVVSNFFDSHLKTAQVWKWVLPFLILTEKFAGVYLQTLVTGLEIDVFYIIMTTVTRTMTIVLLLLLLTTTTTTTTIIIIIIIIYWHCHQG